ncbi:MAG: CoA transferase [Acidimicrobiia bacterium]|nr:CoA transferase [Acidimicrobiia bacterium]MYC44174.1 CoA transferase [Acidimicrobiia bacterium]
MGPLQGVRIVELAGIGPGPFAAMMLADMGAEVICVDRAVPATNPEYRALSGGILRRSRRSVGVDLKNPEGQELVLRLVAGADGLIEGFRPGVAERLGVGPEPCLARNPRLVYGRMTGWGQDGPLAPTAGHDINYIALSGVLSAIGTLGGPPVPPLNLIGDFGGGGMLLALGMVAGMLEAQRSGVGQVIDAAMSEGAALLATAVYGLHGAGWWGERGTNIFDSGAHFYGVYECADGGYMSVGPMEPQFYAELLQLLELDPAGLPHQYDRARWPEARDALAATFATRTRDEWCAVFDGSDACVAPVLDFAEAPRHPHSQARENFVQVDGVTQPAPAPRFSRTPSTVGRPPPDPGADTDEVLTELGLSAGEVATLRAGGVIA